MSGLQVDMNSMFNFGRSLPATNTSLLVLLQQLAAEEALISLPSNHSTGIETATPSPTPSLPRKSGVRGRQVVVNRPNSVSKPISKEKMKRNVNNNRRLLSKDKANKAAAVKGKGDKVRRCWN